MNGARRTWWLLALIVAALALAAAANSVANGFAYDDVYLIVKGTRMHTITGWWREFAHTYWPEDSGGDGYRPLTIIAFRFQYALGGGNPMTYHAVNVVLHAVTAVAVFWLACGVLPLAAAAAAAALYAVHPVHTEAVANVVGQSELWVALLVTLATGLFVHGRRGGAITWKRWLAIGGLYAAALLFKEHAIVLPALVLLAEFTVVRDRAPVRQRLQPLRVPILLLTVVALGYMWARSRVVVGGLSGFQPYVVFQALGLSTGNRILTMIGAAPEWLRLFLWPARLMTEYAPPYIDVAEGPSVTQLPGLLVLLGIVGLFAACWRRSPATSFGIGWLMITLLPASNFVVPAGFIIAERTLLMPSVGVLIAIGSVIPWLYARIERQRALQYSAGVAFAALLALGIARSYTRNRAWRDNGTLFRQAIQDSPQSYRAHFMLGQFLFENKRKTEGEMHYRHAIQLFPLDPLMTLGLAEQYRNAGKCEAAITLYRWFFTLQPNSARGQNGFALCLLNTWQLDEAKERALSSIRAGGNVKDARALIKAVEQGKAYLAAQRANGDSVSPNPPPARPR
jgi:protein O-mannosyl-transferase